jgi:hypothetical protein
MEPLSEALRLMRRQSELEEAMRQPGGIRVTHERELHQLRDSLQEFPVAVRAILEASRRLHRPVDVLSVSDVDAGE